MTVSWMLLGCPVDDLPSDSAASGSGSAGSTGSVEGSSTGFADEGSGGAPPAECSMLDADADASFDLAFGDWDIEQDELTAEVETACTVAAVVVDTDAIETELDCLDEAGMSHPVQLQMAPAEGATPAWASGDSVTLYAAGRSDVGGALPGGLVGQYVIFGFSLHAEDGSLLAAGSDDWTTDSLLSPLTFSITDEDVCGVVEPCSADENLPLAIAVSEPGAETLALLGGHRGQLALADGSRLYVDAPLAHASSDCHFGTSMHVLARRMQ